MNHTFVSEASHANVKHVCEANANMKPLCINDVSNDVAS